jgi:hypothetical protein
MRVVLITTIGRDIKYLEPFLQYYTKLGVHKIYLINHQRFQINIGNPLVEEINKIAHKYSAENVCGWSGEFSEEKKIEIETQVKEQYCSNYDWVMYADLDEFHYFSPSLKKQIKHCEKNGIEAIEGRLFDRVHRSGRLYPYVNYVSLEEQFQYGGYLSRHLLGAWDKKIMVARAYRKIAGGHHIFFRPGNQEVRGYRTEHYYSELDRFCSENRIHHFKWEHNLLEKMENRTKPAEESLAAWGKESREFLRYYRRYGRINMENPVYNFKRVGSVIGV